MSRITREDLDNIANLSDEDASKIQPAVHASYESVVKMANRILDAYNADIAEQKRVNKEQSADTKENLDEETEDDKHVQE